MIERDNLSLMNIDRLRDSYHIMLDIETLGTEPGCAVWQIGMVGASIDDLLDTPGSIVFDELFYGTCKVPHPKEFEDLALIDNRTSVDTLYWQERHNTENYLAATHTYDTESEADMLWLFRAAAIKSAEEARARGLQAVWWSKSVRFDFPILERAMQITETDGGKFPWRYWELQELRTALLLSNLTGLEGRDRYNSHNALADSQHQMHLLSVALHKMNRSAGGLGG